MECDWCNGEAVEPYPCVTEQGKLCEPCTSAYLREKQGDRQARHYGECFRYASADELPAVPRAVAYRSEESWRREQDF